MATTEQEAALALGGKAAVEPPEPVEDVPVADKEAEEDGPETREDRIARMRSNGPPPRAFRWVDDTALTIDNWLVGSAYADIEVFPGVVFRFIEPKSSVLRQADAVVNSMGPAFILTGLMQPRGTRDDVVQHDQWARARTIANLACAIAYMSGDPWPTGKNLREKFDVIDDLGHIKVDRLSAAYIEFTVQLAYVIEVGNLPNS